MFDNVFVINICSVPVPNGPNFVRRPSVLVDNCQDRDPPACFEARKCGYSIRDKCQMEPYKILARQLCPRTCATCCLTKEYNCDNGTTLPSAAATCRDERQNCAAIRATNSCGGVFRTTMMQQCARTCGYCS
ncbi:unnamed protein product [Dracunculus medinensis]|uniref:ShKT domain-containing protein n=1 Tax=Dracunculus medinensis TaxID=318479 RepID=A0A0N4UR27_DRAME|nr:unnamed protein product [Dracunculus medinensis]